MVKSELVALKRPNKEIRKVLMDQICYELYDATKRSKNGKIPYGLVNKIVKRSKPKDPWVTRNVINFAFKKFCHNGKSEIEISKACSKLRLRKLILDQICLELQNASKSNSNNIIPHGFLDKLVNPLMEDYPWLSRDTVLDAYDDFMKERKSTAAAGALATSDEKKAHRAAASDSASDSTSQSISKKDTVKKGTVDYSDEYLRALVEAAKTEITWLFQEEKRRLAKVNGRMQNGWLKNVIQEVKDMMGIPAEVKISISTIRKRKAIILHQDSEPSDTET